MNFISNSERELLVTRIGFEPNINRLRIYYPKPLDERAECVRTLHKTTHKEYYLPRSG